MSLKTYVKNYSLVLATIEGFKKPKIFVINENTEFNVQNKKLFTNEDLINFIKNRKNDFPETEFLTDGEYVYLNTCIKPENKIELETYLSQAYTRDFIVINKKINMFNMPMDYIIDFRQVETSMTSEQFSELKNIKVIEDDKNIIDILTKNKEKYLCIHNGTIYHQVFMNMNEDIITPNNLHTQVLKTESPFLIPEYVSFDVFQRFINIVLHHIFDNVVVENDMKNLLEYKKNMERKIDLCNIVEQYIPKSEIMKELSFKMSNIQNFEYLFAQKENLLNFVSELIDFTEKHKDFVLSVTFGKKEFENLKYVFNDTFERYSNNPKL